ncbi:Crp/Fnr family transcriptional regulator [Microscilla marina]|uniref:Cyclic nucleotide-binding domain protein n=1 Tax=Microscilla marina ATCC 23134 TaxID=313606 RepID=A2A0I2_MICM2|nr:Crp/Fnr family transcriptional regulator [Microscilla marina]EAY23854.1 cyclic nucleotide-binding domain protein [Microscilla marina ATCC 23134]
MEILKKIIQQMIVASDEEANQLVDRCFRKNFEKKNLLSEDEKFIKEVYFIVKGIIRVKINDIEGREHTVHFAIENQFIADYNAFITGEKSNYQLQALEYTETIVLPKSAIEWGYKNMQEGEKLGRLIAEFYFVYLDTRIQHLYTLTPQERYDLMNEIFPNIHQRVPQHMIASYLGITPVHLSRIKKQIS